MIMIFLALMANMEATWKIIDTQVDFVTTEIQSPEEKIERLVSYAYRILEYLTPDMPTDTQQSYIHAAAAYLEVAENVLKSMVTQGNQEIEDPDFISPKDAVATLEDYLRDMLKDTLKEGVESEAVSMLSNMKNQYKRHCLDQTIVGTKQDFKNFSLAFMETDDRKKQKRLLTGASSTRQGKRRRFYQPNQEELPSSWESIG